MVSLITTTATYAAVNDSLESISTSSSYPSSSSTERNERRERKALSELEYQAFLVDDSVPYSVKEIAIALREAESRGEVAIILESADGSVGIQVHSKGSPFSSTTNSTITVSTYSSNSSFEPLPETDSDLELDQKGRTSIRYDFDIRICRGLGLRILCLDGGGVRGMSALVTLSVLQQKMKEMGHADLPPAAVFDLIVGTSTGGIIALLLGRCGFTIQQCITIYKTFAQAIFKIPVRQGGKYFNYVRTNARYDSNVLLSKMEEVIGKCFGDKNAPLASRSGFSCKCAVVACKYDNMDSGEATIFRSYDTPIEPASTATIVQAARATSAAPTFFKEQVIDGIKYIDGGIGNNNPALHALAEVDTLWPGREVDAFVSIGTGTARNISAKNLKIASISLTTSSHLPHEKIIEMGIFRSDQYFRFNVPNLGSDVDLSDWEQLDYIGAATRRYLNAPGIRDQVKSCAEALCGKLSESI